MCTTCATTGACVDVVPHETDRYNNCTARVRFHLTNPQGHPDLYIIWTFAGHPGGALRPGFLLPLIPAARNIGDAKSAPTTLRWYVWEDASPGSGETGSQFFTPENEFRTRAIGELYPFAVQMDARRVAAPEEPGDYEYGFCVDPVPGEVALENCNAGIEVRISAPN